MLLFLQHKCASNASTTATAWCDGEAVLAVAGLKGDIKLYNDEVRRKRYNNALVIGAQLKGMVLK